MCTREIREGWPLLTVETAVNGDSRSTNEKGPFLVGSLGLLADTREFCFALAALVVQNIFFLTALYFSSYVPIASKLGRQLCWVACLSVCVSGVVITDK